MTQVLTLVPDIFRIFPLKIIDVRKKLTMYPAWQLDTRSLNPDHAVFLME